MTDPSTPAAPMPRNPYIQVPLWLIGIFVPLLVSSIMAIGGALMSVRDITLLTVRRVDVLEAEVGAIKGLTENLKLLMFKVDTTMNDISSIKRDIDTMKGNAFFNTNLNHSKKDR